MDFTRLLLPLLLLMMFNPLALKAQQLLKSDPFSLRTPFLEPDERKLTLKVNEHSFVMLVKTKGSLSGSGDYMLEFRDDDLGKEWSKYIEVSSEENFLDMMSNDKEIILFSVEHNSRKNSSKLMARGYSLQSGTELWQRKLMEKKVGSRYDTYNKGARVQKIKDYIMSGSRRDFVTPLEYQFELAFSPDRQKVMAYYYDYSKPDLKTNLFVYDKNLKVLHRAQIPIDKGYLNYGLYINNAGVLFIMNADYAGNLALIRYNMATKENDFLKLPSGNLRRTDFTLRFASDQVPYVVCLNERGGQLNGVLLCRFDFSVPEISRNMYHPLGNSFRHELDSAMYGQYREKGKWNNFDITDFYISKEGKKVVFAEQREYIYSGVNYEPDKPTDPELWKERKAMLEVGEVLMFAFSEEDSLEWNNFVVKNQSNMAADGLNSMSFSWNIAPDNRLQLLYAHGEQTGRGMNELKNVTFDMHSGQLLYVLDLPMDDKYAYIRPYTFWTESGQVVIAGRKALSGRSSELMKFNLEGETASQAMPEGQ
jgi:hypothetical protein